MGIRLPGRHPHFRLAGDAVIDRNPALAYPGFSKRERQAKVAAEDALRWRKVERQETEAGKRKRLQEAIDALEWPASGLTGEEREAHRSRIRGIGRGWFGGHGKGDY